MKRKRTHRVLGIEHAIWHELCHGVEIATAIPTHVGESSRRHIESHSTGGHLLCSSRLCVELFSSFRLSRCHFSSVITFTGDVLVSRIGLFYGGSTTILFILLKKAISYVTKKKQIKIKGNDITWV